MAVTAERQAMRVDFERLREDVEALAQVGSGPEHGLYRMAFSEGDMAGREWLKGRLEEAGLRVYEDGAANIHGCLDLPSGERRPSVVVGSHIDTVPGGGHLDGALGVLVGVECLRRFRESGVMLEHPLEVVAFTDEEGRFGGMFGSQAMAGLLTPQDIYKARDLEGNTLVDVMAARGLDARAALDARRDPKTVHAYLELHIEQGPVLDRKNLGVGIVEAITGLFKWDIRLIGTPNHAGTTPMPMRNDALSGLAEFANEIPRILEEDGTPHSVATIGRVSLSPGAANTVPGRADFSLDVRDTEPETLAQLADAFRKALSAIARRRGLMFEFDILSEIEPVSCDRGLEETLAMQAEALATPYIRMPSGAAHDAQSMAKLTRVAMIFVRSRDGKSHSPAEWTPWEDVQAGADIMLNSLLELAS